jgi:hypothetical protein
MHIFWYISLRLIAQTEALEILHIMRKPYLVIVSIYLFKSEKYISVSVPVSMIRRNND